MLADAILTSAAVAVGFVVAVTVDIGALVVTVAEGIGGLVMATGLVIVMVAVAVDGRTIAVMEGFR